jgi:hypothetical protein
MTFDEWLKRWSMRFQRMVMTPESFARLFHDTYEREAHNFGYVTRADTKQFDPESANGRLMIHVCGLMLQAATAAERERWVSVVRYASNILAGEGVQDQGDAFDKCARVLDRALSDAETGEG